MLTADRPLPIFAMDRLNATFDTNPSLSPLSRNSSNLDEIVQEACQISVGLPTISDREEDCANNGAAAAGLLRRRSPPYILKKQRPRPLVTLRYMQTLDGSLTIAESHLPDVKRQSMAVSQTTGCATGSVCDFVGRYDGARGVMHFYAPRVDCGPTTTQSWWECIRSCETTRSCSPATTASSRSR